jgi:ATP-dependent helicase/nuclease subunit A
MQNPEIAKFWADGARAEVPIAGMIGDTFYSFRIDRLIERGDEVLFLDYKTDTSRALRDEYIIKLKKYATLLARIFPHKKIHGHILWLHDWELEEVTEPLEIS